MLTPEQVNAYAGLLAAPWDELNERILRDMVRRIVKAGGVTATAEWQSYRAQALGASKAYLIQQMNLIVQQIGPKEAAIFAQAMKQAYGIDVNDAAKAGPGTPYTGGERGGAADRPERLPAHHEHPVQPDPDPRAYG